MRLNIIKGKAFQADFVVKKNGSTMALVLHPADTGTFTLYTTGPNPVVVIDAKALTMYDADNGTFRLNLTAEETAGLVGKVGFEEDGYPAVPTYKAVLEFMTADQGQMLAELQQVYVTDIGL